MPKPRPRQTTSPEVPPRPPTRLFLITPPDADADFAPLLERVCKLGDVASVLIWTEQQDPKGALARAKALVPAVQATGAAALVRGDTQLVGRAGADGLHSDGSLQDLEEALSLQPDRIVGAANLRSRHDAMTAGERGADYVFFGHPAPGETRGNATELLMERAAWWQEIFESPCVVYAPTLELAGPLAAAGADFVALGEALWTAPEGPEKAITAVVHAIAVARSHAEAVV